VTRSFNLADLQSPVPASAYFGALPDSASIIRQKMELCTETICEDLYFPTIAIPTRVTELEPAFASCSPFVKKPGYVRPISWIDGGWDPPIVLTATAVGPKAILPLLPTITPVVIPATPGAMNFAPNLPAITRTVPSDTRPDSSVQQGVAVEPQAHINPQNEITLALERPIISSQVIELAGGAIVTVSRLPGKDFVSVNSQLLIAGGPPVEVGGVRLSLGPKGRLDLGGSRILSIPQEVHIQTTIIRLGGQDIMATMEKARDSSGGSLMIGTLTVRPGDQPLTMNGRVLSLDVNGILSEDTKAIATFSWSSAQDDEDHPQKERVTVENQSSDTNPLETKPPMSLHVTTKRNMAVGLYDRIQSSRTLIIVFYLWFLLS
jgi:hypothetical protein